MPKGLRVGAPVRLSGVDIGNVSKILIVREKDRQLTPVKVFMKVSTKYDFNLRRDSVTSLDTAGVLGETYLDIDSSQAVGPIAQNGDTLPTHVHPDFNEVVRSSQSTLQNMDALLKRADRIMAFVESGKGSIGKLIYDPTLYDRFSQTVAELKTVVDEIAKGQGSLGQLINSNDAYNKFVATLDKMNGVVDDLQQGKGTAGKFLKDPSLYNNANDTVANLKKVSEDLNAGKGTAGRLLKDEELGKKIDTTMTKLAALTSRTRSGTGNSGKTLQGRYALQQRQPDAGGEPEPGKGDPGEPEEVSQHQAAHFLRTGWRGNAHLSSRAKRGILVFAGGGSIDGAGKNPDPSLRSG